MTTGTDVFAAARRWKLTPYHHQARLRGVGVDCIGLEIGVCRELGLVEQTFDVTGYSRQADGFTLMKLSHQYMTEIDGADKQFGDVVVTGVAGVPHHFGILAPYRHGGFSIIHAHYEHGVIETRLMFSSAMQFVAAFRLPGIQ